MGWNTLPCAWAFPNRWHRPPRTSNNGWWIDDGSAMDFRRYSKAMYVQNANAIPEGLVFAEFPFTPEGR